MREIENNAANASGLTEENALRKEALTEFHRFMSGNLKHVDTDENRVVSEREFDQAIGSGRYAGQQLQFLKAWKEQSYNLASTRIEDFWLMDAEVSRMDVFDFGLATRRYINDRQQATNAAEFLKNRFDAISGQGDLFFGELCSYRDKNPKLSAEEKACLTYLIDHFSDAGRRPRTFTGRRFQEGARRIRPDEVHEFVSSVDYKYRVHSDVYTRIKDIK